MIFFSLSWEHRAQQKNCVNESERKEEVLKAEKQKMAISFNDNNCQCHEINIEMLLLK